MFLKYSILYSFLSDFEENLCFKSNIKKLIFSV